jgi:Family of unknown function (DUF6152)
MFRSLSLIVVVVMLALIAPAFAHHGWGSYDAQRAMTLEVKLDQVHYRNPHAEVSITHQGKTWNAVLAPTTRMSARGLPDGALAAGKTITIVGYPRTDGTPELRAERIIVDGRTIELR